MNKSTRFKDHPNKIYDCYCEIELPSLPNGFSAHSQNGLNNDDFFTQDDLPSPHLESSMPYLIDLSEDGPSTNSSNKLNQSFVQCSQATQNTNLQIANNRKEKKKNETRSQARISRRYPHSFKDEEILKSVPQFAYPCHNMRDISTVTLFSFVLTNVDSKWTFGYCRLAPDTNTCLVMLSHLPWHDTFFRIINEIALLALKKHEPHALIEFLRCLYACEIPPPGGAISIGYMSTGKPRQFTAPCPDVALIPSIPQDRNLTEYFNAIDVGCMISIFASMLNERRILVTSRRLDRLSACVQAANSLIYPMHWQHIFIPILPIHLLDYLSAPMPFLIGVPEQTLNNVNIRDLGEIVILYADKNEVQSPFDDVKALPSEILQTIQRHLRGPVTIGDSVARAFLKALVVLIGGYRDALEFNNGDKITFNFEKFVKTRSPIIQPFLERMLHLQIFLQFIEERLDILNAGEGFNDEFEYEVNLYEESSSAKQSRVKYQEWLMAMKNGGRLLRSLNPAMRMAYKNVRDRSKRAFNDLRVKINDTTSNDPRPSFIYHRF